MTMISQRSAALNKMVLTQIETLIVLRITSPQDRKAIEGWLEYQGQSKEVSASLPELENGEAWVWSPHYLKVLQRVKIFRRNTFDSAATPKESKGDRPAATLADVDLGAIQKKMTATIERAKAEDPRELRRRIAELQQEVQVSKKVGKKETLQPTKTTIEKIRVEVPVIKNSQLTRIERLIGQIEKRREAITTYVQSFDALKFSLSQAASEMLRAVNRVKESATTMPAVERQKPIMPTPLPPSPLIPRAADVDNEVNLGYGERKILIAIAQYNGGVSPKQLTILTGYKRSTRNT